MSRICDLTGARRSNGTRIIRKGKAKKKGGIGLHVTANSPRQFLPNLRRKRIFVPELNRFVTVKVTARALKTITRHGAYAAFKSAGIV